MEWWSTLLVILSAIFLIVGSIAFLIIVFRESIAAGLVCIFIPFIGQIVCLYYLIKRWNKAKNPFFIVLIGTAILLGGILPPMMQHKAEIKPVIIEFTEAVAEKNVDAAYRCVESGADKEKLGDFVNSNYPLCKGCVDVNIKNLQIQTSADATTGYISGFLVYTNQAKRSFEATLVKEGEVWKILTFWIGD